MNEVVKCMLSTEPANMIEPADRVTVPTENRIQGVVEKFRWIKVMILLVGH